MDTFAVILLALVMLAGIVGTILPFLPGLPLVWAAALVYGVVEGFGVAGWVAFAIITLVGAAGMVAGTALPHRHVTAAGVPRSTVWAGAALGIVGFFVIPVIGLPLGAAAGVMMAEHRRLGTWGRAWTGTKALLKGFGIGALVQFLAGTAMLAVWIGWVVVDRVG